MTEQPIRRSQQIVTITSRTPDGAITWGTGTTYGGRTDGVEVGREYIIETIRGSIVVGIRTDTDWLWRDTDEDIHARDRAFHERVTIDREARLAANRADLEARTAALPPLLRARIERFHTNGRHAFELSGWGYELAVCELAALYAADPVDQAAIDACDEAYGCSGDQHDCAQALARVMADDDIDLFPAAFFPVTGDPDYSQAGQA